MPIEPGRPRPGQGPRLSCGRYPVRGVAQIELDGSRAALSASGGVRFLLEPSAISYQPAAQKGPAVRAEGEL